MPKLQDLLPDSTIDKMKKIKAKSVSSNYVGQTPNLNSSLGVNAADGEVSTTEATQEGSKLNEFYEKNQSLLDGILGGVLSGITGTKTSGTTTTGGYVPPAPQEKKKILGMPPALFWILLIVILLIAAIIIYKKVKK